MAEVLKKHQCAMTIAEQIENLKALGLQIDDEEYAKRILNGPEHKHGRVFQRYVFRHRNTVSGSY